MYTYLYIFIFNTTNRYYGNTTVVITTVVIMITKSMKEVLKSEILLSRQLVGPLVTYQVRAVFFFF